MATMDLSPHRCPPRIPELLAVKREPPTRTRLFLVIEVLMTGDTGGARCCRSDPRRTDEWAAEYAAGDTLACRDVCSKDPAALVRGNPALQPRGHGMGEE